VGVIDRDISPGVGGILWSELRACAAPNALVQNYMMGLGGGDVQPMHISKVLDELCARKAAEEPRIVEVG
jgi:pyruvate/2-oxoacid:ferredoxin oxidoreductase alpha subunit